MSESLTPGHVRVKCGIHNMTFPNLVGRTTGEVAARLREVMNIDPHCQIRVNGGLSNSEYLLKDQDLVEYVRPQGEKAFPGYDAPVKSRQTLPPEDPAMRAAQAYLAIILPDNLAEMEKRLTECAKLLVSQVRNELGSLAIKVDDIANAQGDIANAQGTIDSGINARLTGAETRLAHLSGSIIVFNTDRTNSDISLSKYINETGKNVSKRLDAITDRLTAHANRISALESRESRQPEASCEVQGATSTPAHEGSSKMAEVKINVNGPRIFGNLLVAALVSVVAWGGARLYRAYNFDSNYTTYMQKAKEYAAKDKEKAKKYSDRALVFLESENLKDGRTDYLLDAGPEADVGDWYKDVQFVASRIHKEAEKADEISLPTPPHGVFSDISLYPMNRQFFYWFAGSLAAAVLGGVGFTWTKMRR